MTSTNCQFDFVFCTFSSPKQINFLNKNNQHKWETTVYIKLPSIFFHKIIHIHTKIINTINKRCYNPTFSFIWFTHSFIIDFRLPSISTASKYRYSIPICGNESGWVLIDESENCFYYFILSLTFSLLCIKPHLMFLFYSTLMLYDKIQHTFTFVWVYVV